MVKESHHLTRRISHNLSPYTIENDGLVEALHYFVKNNNQKDTLQFYTNIIDEKVALPLKISSILFCGMQELIQNALKHAKADQITVQIVKNNEEITLSVEDNGIGSTPTTLQNSSGIGALTKRINLIGGTLEIETSENLGTTIFIHLNLKK
jgi:signal transduction histidine kinase